MKELSFQPKFSEVVTPREFLKITKKQESNIKSVKIIPPRLGGSNFGKIRIEYITPIFSLPEKKS